jgi:hypothetical protein
MKPAVTAALDDRFFEGMVQGHTHLYDAIEIQPVSDLYAHPEEGMVCETDYVNPTFFSVYLHLKTGGVECVGDHGTHALALAYASELSEEHGWPINDYVPRKFHDKPATELPDAALA